MLIGGGLPKFSWIFVQPRNLKKKVIPILICACLSNCHGNNLKRTPPAMPPPPRNKACLVKGLLTGGGGIWGGPLYFHEIWWQRGKQNHEFHGWAVRKVMGSHEQTGKPIFPILNVRLGQSTPTILINHIIRRFLYMSFKDSLLKVGMRLSPM